MEPIDLTRLRNYWHEKNLARGTIKAYLQLTKSVFKWACANGYANGSLHSILSCVEVPTRGHGSGRVTQGVKPVDESDFRAVCFLLSTLCKSAVRVLWLTGMRIGELLQMKPEHLDTSHAVWRFKPPRHKTSHRGVVRVIFIGPQAQAQINRRLAKTRPGHRLFPFANNSVNSAIDRACDALEIPHWHPHQLRHAFGTRVNELYGFEAAQVALGHKFGNSTTAIYAERNLTLAERIALEIG